METDAQPQPQEPEQVENPRLVAAIAELSGKQSDENWRHFYKELMESTFLLVAANPAGDGAAGELPRAKALQVAFVALRDDVGQVMVPAFTDTPTLQTWAPAGHPWMVVPAPALLREIVKNPAAQLEINRHAEGQWRVTHDEIVALVKGEVPQRAVSAEALEEMILHPETSIKPLPGNWPAELISVLWNALVLQRAVVDAYAFDLSLGNSRYAVVGLRFTEKPDPAFFTETSDKLLALGKRLLPPGQSLEGMALNERDVLARVAKSVEPFFARR
ncbi:MAG TPA: SseB family protein [Terriglobales bacterium]|nr:SseB family protein [Terriglobales bacterium]